MEFSAELIEKTKAYFFKRCSRELTNDEAERALEQLGKLGLLALEILNPKPTPSSPRDRPKGNRGPMAALGVGGRASGSALRSRRVGCVAPEDGSEAKRQRHGHPELLSEGVQTPHKDDD